MAGLRKYLLALAVATSCALGYVAVVGAAPQSVDTDRRVAPLRSGATDVKLTRAQALDKARIRYAAFDRAQRAGDALNPDPATSSPANTAAAAKISETSRRVVATPEGEAFAFFNAENKACLLWSPKEGGVAGSGCTHVDTGEPPGILMFYGDTQRSTVSGLVPRGVDAVTATYPDGTAVSVPVSEGAYVYHGKGRYTVTWKAPGGESGSSDVSPVDVSKLTPVGK